MPLPPETSLQATGAPAAATHARRLLQRVLGRAGIERRQDGWTLHWSLLDLIVAGGVGLAIAWMCFWVALEIYAIARFPFFSPVSLVEEVMYTYTSAGNYLRFGFLNSGLLQDFSSSSNPAHHPYVYNHMPPGPDIFTALILGVTGSYRAVRATYVVIFVLGLVTYVQFVNIILRANALRGGAYAIFFLGPWMIMQNFERHTASPQPVLLFAPLVALTAYYGTGRRWYFVASMAISLLASVYLDYTVLAAALGCWTLLWVTGLIRLERRHLVWFFATVAVGVALHLVQNLLFFGPETFVRELTMTLSNRIWGIPGQEAMKEFYQEIGAVHHGARTVDVLSFISVLERQFAFFGRRPTVVLLLVLIAAYLAREGRVSARGDSYTLRSGEGTRSISFLVRVVVWASGTVLVPMVMFPAFAQEVNLYGARTNFYFQGLVPLTICALAMIEIVRYPPSFAEATTWAGGRGLVGVAIWLGLIALVTATVAVVFRDNFGEFRHVVHDVRRAKPHALAELSRFEGAVFMTNINAPTVGFFVREAGYGVCDEESITPGGSVDVDRCKVGFMRRGRAPLPAPTHFVFFSARELFPGFADCLPENSLVGQDRGGDECVARLRSRLGKSFTLVYDNPLFEVYQLDLFRPPGPTAKPRF